jgi:outer membrane protein OmpA-like peptidoglycan-associated protein
MLQTKLTVNQPGDRFEQEADRVAKIVAGAPDPQSLGTTPITGRQQRQVQSGCPKCQTGISAGAATGIQRVCSQCEEELHRKPTNSGAHTEASATVDAQVGSMRGGGQPLPGAVRSFFEQRLSQDFGAVRVHTGRSASETTEALNARAYTVGNDIAFAPGQYSPATSEGRQLLAHELTHVVQQGASTGLLQRACKPAGIGTPVGCTDNREEPVGDLVFFRVDCDDFITPAEQTKVEAFADSMTDTDRVRVHGFASIDGDPTFNDNLSCARALRTALILQGRGISPAKIEILKHGATPGPANQRRSAVLERVPGASRPTVPQLSAPITVGPTPGACGDMNMVINWTLSRNSDPTNGGFIVQEITEAWHADDCTGTALANPDPRTSPLHFFEAWRVDPGTRNISSCVTTDTWFWPGAAPWGGGCSTGNVSITGHAVYFDNVAAAAMPAHMVINNGATFSGCLQSSVTDPALGGSASRAVDRQLTFHWNCCPCSSSPTVVDNARV